MEPKLRRGADVGAARLPLIFGPRAWQTDRASHENAEELGPPRSPQCSQSLAALPRPFARHLFGFCAAGLLGRNGSGCFAGTGCSLSFTLQRRAPRKPNRVNGSPPKLVIRRPHLNFVLPQLRDDALHFRATNFGSNFVTNFELILHEGEFARHSGPIQSWRR